MKGFFLNLTLGITLVALQACATSTTFSGRPNSKYHDGLYSNLREARFFTIDKVLYQTKAAYFDETLVREYVDEYAKRYRLPRVDREKMLAGELKDLEEHYIFYISHFSTQKEASKLGKESSTWRLSLVSGQEMGEDEDVEASALKSLDSDDPYVQYFFPFVTPWSKNYRVLFPKSFDAPLELRISGVLDQVSFRWDR